MTSAEWELDPGDPSVGIFGDTLFHLTCGTETPAELVTVTVTPHARLHGVETVTDTYGCPCGARVDLVSSQPAAWVESN